VTNVSPGGDVTMAWDPVPSPDLRLYRVHRGSAPGFTPGPANLVALRTSSSFTDPGAAPGSVVQYYKVAAEDFVGNIGGFGLTSSGTVGVPPQPVAHRFAFSGPQPNPSSGDLRFNFELPEAGVAELKIFDVSGRLVRRALSGTRLAAGEQSWQWDARDDRRHRVSAGVYLARLSFGRNVATRRLLLLE
jgi:hypothetical protein